MACQYSFRGINGENITLNGIPALKAYMLEGGLEQFFPDTLFPEYRTRPVRNAALTKQVLDSLRETPLLSAEEAQQHLTEAFGPGIERLVDNGILNFTQGKAYWPENTLINANGDEEAVFYKGRTYIDLEHTPKDRLNAVVLHELGEHFNLRKMLGAQAYHNLQQQIRNRAQIKGSEASRVWAIVKRDYDHLEEGSEPFIAEVIAKLGEINPNAPWYRRLLAQIKSFLVKMGLGRGFVAGTLTEADLHDLLITSLIAASRAPGSKPVLLHKTSEAAKRFELYADRVGLNPKVVRGVFNSSTFEDIVKNLFGGESYSGVQSSIPYRIQGEAPAPERFRESTIPNTDTLGDIIGSKAFLQQGYSGLDIEAKRRVDSAVLSSGKDNKVFDSVIELIPIEVMDLLRREQLSPQMLFHDPAMFWRSVQERLGPDITTGVNASRALVEAVALARAIENSGGGPLDAAWMAKNFGTASNTIDFNHVGNTTRFNHKKQDLLHAPQFSFLGENAKTADKFALQTAKDRLQRGDDPEAVRVDTGWYKGPDGHFRFEISDHQARLTPTAALVERMLNGDMGEDTPRLREIWDHPQLYAAYPQLANTKIILDYRKQHGSGSYSPSKDLITLGLTSGAAEFRSLIGHEVQHAIQEAADHARGGTVGKNPTDISTLVSLKDSAEDGYARALENGGVDPQTGMTAEFYSEQLDSLLDEINDFEDPYSKYFRIYGEIEARNTQARLDMSEGERRFIEPEMTQDVPTDRAIIVFNGREMPSEVQFSRKAKPVKPYKKYEFDELEMSSWQGWAKQAFKKMFVTKDVLAKQKYALLTQKQLAEISKFTLPGLKGYIKNLDALEAEAARWLRKSNRLVTEKWEKLDAKTKKQLDRVINESTLSDIDASQVWSGVTVSPKKDVFGGSRDFYTVHSQTNFVPGYRERLHGLAQKLNAFEINKTSVVFEHEKDANSYLRELKALEQEQIRKNWAQENASRKKAHAELRNYFNALPDTAKEVYSESNAMYNEVFQARLGAIEKTISEAVENYQTRRELIAQVRAKFESQSLNWYYAHLGRYGNYWLYGANKEGERFFRTFESQRDRDDFVPRFEASGGIISGKGVNTENLESLEKAVGVNDGFIAKINTQIANDESMSDDSKKSLQDNIYQLYLASMPEVSMRKHSLHRKGTAGFNEDSLRNFSNSMHHAAKQLANMIHGSAMRKILNDQNEILEIAESNNKRDIAEKNLEAARRLLDGWDEFSQKGALEAKRNEAVKAKDEREKKIFDMAIALRNRFIAAGLEFDEDQERAQESLRLSMERIQALLRAADLLLPKDLVSARYRLGELTRSYHDMMTVSASDMDKVATTINQFNFIAMLGASFSSALVNTVQTPGVAMPVVIGRYGVGETGKAFTHTLGEFITAVKDGLRDSDGNASISEVIKRNLRAAEARGDYAEAHRQGERMRALEKWKDDNTISGTQTYDIIGIGQEGSDYGGIMTKLSKRAGWMFHHGERLNREVTLLAAFDLARAEGKSQDDARAYAKWVVDTAHLDYSTQNAARFFRGAPARIALQFKKYQQGMLFNWVKMFSDAAGKIKRENYPAGDAGDALFKVALQQKREAKRSFMALLFMQTSLAGALGLPGMGMLAVAYKLLGDMLGDDDDPHDLERDLRLGLAEYFPAPVAESAAKGFFNTFTPIDLAARFDMADIFFREPLKELEGRDAATHYLASLFGPTGGQVEKVAQAFKYASDGMWGRSAEMFLPKAAADIAKAIRFETEGAKTTRGMPIKEMSEFEAFLQGIGFGNAALERQYAERGFGLERETLIKDNRSALLHKVAWARLNHELLPVEELREWRQRHPEWPIRGDDVRRSMHQIRKDIHTREIHGYAVNPKLEYLYEENAIMD